VRTEYEKAANHDMDRLGAVSDHGVCLLWRQQIRLYGQPSSSIEYDIWGSAESITFIILGI